MSIEEGHDRGGISAARCERFRERSVGHLFGAEQNASVLDILFH